MESGPCLQVEAFRILAETAALAGDFDGFTNQNHHPILVRQIQGGAYQTE